jgi:hypothetical protein
VMLEGVAARMGPRLAGALMFASAGRGRAMFGSPDHDSSVAHDRLDVPVTGLYSAAELAPVGQRVRVNRHTATMLVLGAGKGAVAGHQMASRPRQMEAGDGVTDEVRDFLARMVEQGGDG